MQLQLKSFLSKSFKIVCARCIFISAQNSVSRMNFFTQKMVKRRHKTFANAIIINNAAL